jgi:7-carboxy-7-deazaguanine synthase
MGSRLLVRQGSEIKVVIPQADQPMEEYASLAFEHHFVQAMDGPDQAKNLLLAIEYCKKNPKWKLSVQTHKLLQIP